MLYYLGIDIGGTKTAAGLLDSQGALLAEAELPTEVSAGPERIAQNTARLARSLLARSAGGEVPYVGVGCPGSIDGRRGVVKYANNLNFEEVPLAGMLERELGLPVVLENDANCAGLGEYFALPDPDAVESFFIVTLGTGVGTAFVWNGRLFTGFNGAAPEMGHCTLDAEGPVCDCGNRGCWEMYCAGHSLTRDARAAARNDRASLMWQLAGGVLEKIDGRVPFEAARRGDAAAQAVVRRYLYYFKAGVGNVINAFQPQVLTIGGGISREGTLFLDAAREAIEEQSYCKTLEKTQVRAAVLGAKAGIYGAVLLRRKP